MTQVLGGKVYVWCDTESNYNVFWLLSNVNLKRGKSMTEDVTKNRNAGKNMQEEIDTILERVS